MVENKQIKITCKTKDYLDLDQLVMFQGRLKLRTQKDIDILVGYILEQGFSCPFFVWDKNGTYFILDGHGRYLALDYLKSQGYEIPKVPVVIIEAENEQDARLKVLEINNINGEFSKEVLLDYARELTLDYENLKIPGLDLTDINIVPEEYSAEEKQPDYRSVVCPKCNHSFTVRVE